MEWLWWALVITSGVVIVTGLITVAIIIRAG